MSRKKELLKKIRTITAIENRPGSPDPNPGRPGTDHPDPNRPHTLQAQITTAQEKKRA